MPVKYTTFSFPLYLNLIIPFPFLSVVYFKLLIPSNFCKFSILFAIAFNPVVSLIFPSLPNMYWLNFTPSYSTSIYAPPVSSTFISSALYSFPNASFNDSNTLSTAVKYFSIFSAVISLLLKYITLSLLAYFNVNIPFPFLSVVYFNSLIPCIVFKLFIFPAIVFNPVVSLIFPSLLNTY